MKHILVICDPPAAPGYLPRVRYLCDFLMCKGYKVTLLTEEYQSFDFTHTYPIQSIRMYSGGTFDWIIKAVWTLLTDWHNKAFAQRAIWGKNSIVSGDPIDLVLCSAFSDFPLGAAARIARALEVPLLCDIRDLDEQVDDSRYQYHHQQWWTMPFRRIYRAVHIRRRNKVLRAADAITTVSTWHADFIRRFNANTHVVYNGFDQKQFYPQNVRSDRFTVTYIGSLFEWQQPALQKVQQAVEELGVDLDIHTPQIHPVSHDQLGDAIRRSSIMLVLTNAHTHGMLTTKFYEALGCKKPILCVPDDQGELAQLIRYTNAGIATDSTEQIKAFIEKHYAEWQKNRYTCQHTTHQTQFSREHQCEVIRQLIESTIHD